MTLGESFFQAAKIRMALGDVTEALPLLAKAIDLDHFYALKAAADGDFQPHDRKLRGYLEAMRSEKFRQLESAAQSILTKYAFWRTNDRTAAGNPLFQRLETLLASGSSSTLFDLLSVSRELDQNARGVHAQAEKSLVRVVKREVGPDTPYQESYSAEEEYQAEESYPSDETYMQEVVIRPGGLFRKPVTEMRQATRTVMKTRQVMKTRTVIKTRTAMKKNEIITTEFYNGLGKELTPDDLRGVLPEKEWRMRYGRKLPG